MDEKRIQELIASARGAMANAYAPYSGFCVGAAALAESGKVYTGCNVENASYGLTVCAERVAFFAAACAGERRIVAVAVITGSVEIENCCGACLQVMAEFRDAENPMTVINAAADGRYRLLQLDELLPFAFRLGEKR